MKTNQPPARSNYEKPKPPYPYSKDIQGYQKAVWDFMLEHSDVQESGAIFVKFHTSGRDNFEKRVLSRWHYGYHRENVQDKEQKHQDLRKLHTERKIEKELKWEQYKADRKRAFKRKERKEKVQSILRTLLRPVRALLPRGKDNSQGVLPGKDPQR